MCTFYAGDDFQAKGRVYKFGKSFGRVPKDKTCIVSGFSIKNGKVIKEGEVFMVDQMFGSKGEPTIYFITRNFFEVK
jgi:hypothetical protein